MEKVDTTKWSNKENEWIVTLTPSPQKTKKNHHQIADSETNPIYYVILVNLASTTKK